MNRISVLLIVLFSMSTLSFTPIEQPHIYTTTIKSDTALTWLSWEEAMALHEKEPKKIILNVYTEWCAWCARMDKTTFEDPHLAKYINDNFYTVKLDAEFKEELMYKGQAYNYIKRGKKGYHMLAAKLLSGRMSYPTTVFMDNDLQVIQSIVGYKTPAEFEKIVTYFAEGHYQNTPWSVYQDSYKPVLIKD